MADLKDKQVYFMGDLAKYTTGDLVEIHGGSFREVVLLDGHLKGKKRLISVKYDKRLLDLATDMDYYK